MADRLQKLERYSGERSNWNTPRGSVPEPYFRTEGLTVGYDGRPLISDIEIGVERGEILTLFNGLYDVATIDGDLGKSEAAIISRLADMLGVTNAELRQIRAQFVPEAPEHYALLGLMPEASVSEIKSAFHRAVLENHPDRVAHLGEQAARMATQRFLEVQKAYEAIRQERGF